MAVNFAQHVPELLDSTDWKVDLENASGRVAHMNLFGATLTRFDVTVELQNMPVEYMQHLLLRPETLASKCNLAMFPSDLRPTSYEIMKCIAPGDVIVRGWETRLAQRKLVVLCASVFGSLYQRPPLEELWRTSLLRDSPEPGDCMLAFLPCDVERYPYFAAGLHCRDLGDQIARCTYILQVKQDFCPFPRMCRLFYGHFLARLAVVSNDLLNDPNRPQLVAASRNLYAVLTMKGWKKKGHVPLLPTGLESATLHMTTAGGCTSYWKYAAEDASMSEYLESFFKHLFPDRQIQVYDYLDGQQLVHYQCAIKKEDWHYVKPSFEEAFLIHRSAFRRAHGGCIGPSLVDVCPARAWNRMCFSESPQAESMAEIGFVETEVVVEKKTFLDLDEPAITRRKCRIETI